MNLPNAPIEWNTLLDILAWDLLHEGKSFIYCETIAAEIETAKRDPESIRKRGTEQGWLPEHLRTPAPENKP